MSQIDKILRAFAIDINKEHLTSLYDYAPVYRFNYGGRDYVLKRTGVRSEARADSLKGWHCVIANWTKYLVSQGIKSVAPVKDFDPNPITLFSEQDNTKENWVIYPYIEGISYTGSSNQIFAAGTLLGMIHAAGMEANFKLKVSKTVVAIENKKIAAEIDIVIQKIKQYAPLKLETTKNILNSYSQHYLNNALPKLLKIDLPLTNCSWDYKAANLIYQTDTDPVLIDPDHGGRIPRMYDLATALLLFHCDLIPAPKRMFTPAEWAVFLEGYKQYVKPTVKEQKTWSDLLLCAWIDQALWLLSHFPKGWADINESNYLLNLLTPNLAEYSLSS